MNMQNYGGIILTGETDWSTRALWHSYQQNRLVAKFELLAKEVMNLALRGLFIHTSKGTCRRILNGADCLTSPLKGGVVLIFYRV
jgi:hypothetical protein